MKTDKSILLAFILNLAFSVFEFIGGIITGSVAIVSDAVHDTGDAVSIGISYIFEKKSKKQPNCKYTYGYLRYSVIGGSITGIILIIGSLITIYNAISKIITPTDINYNGMIIFAVIGVCVNLCAALITRGQGSMNQKAVNLHMLEDVLGWLVVLAGAVVMRLTNIAVIDPIMSICVSVFILICACMNIKEILDLLLEKTPRNIDIDEIKERIEKIEGVIQVHHVHVWSLDEQNNCATMHVVTDRDTHEVKESIKLELAKHGIGHVTIETENQNEHCCDKCCDVKADAHHIHGHKHRHGNR